MLTKIENRWKQCLVLQYGIKVLQVFCQLFGLLWLVMWCLFVFFFGISSFQWFCGLCVCVCVWCSCKCVKNTCFPSFVFWGCLILRAPPHLTIPVLVSVCFLFLIIFFFWGGGVFFVFVGVFLVLFSFCSLGLFLGFIFSLCLFLFVFVCFYLFLLVYNVCV